MDVSSSLILIVLVVISCSRTYSKELEVNAFEYSRRIPSIKSLDLGHCVHRIEELFPGHHVQKKCTLPPRGGPISHTATNTNDTRYLQLHKIKDVFDTIGLCAGSSSSALGLLNNGQDCTAVDIAGMLTFGAKTHIQAYIENFQSEKMELVRRESLVPPALIHHFDDNYFLHSRSHGTLEVLILEIRYPSKRQTERLKVTDGRAQHVSSFLNTALHEVGKPSSLKLIRLSTAKEQYEVIRFKRNNINDAFSKIAEYESDMYHIRYDIQKQHIRPHLKYGLLPYTGISLNNLQSKQATDNDAWAKATELEVKLTASLKRHKRISRECKRTMVDLCSYLPNNKRSLMKIQSDIHSIRSKWYEDNNSRVNTIKSQKKEARTLQNQLIAVSKKIRSTLKLKRKSSKRKGKGGKRTRKPRQ